MMERDEIIRLAKEAGFGALTGYGEVVVEKFAHLVAAEYKRDAERYRWLRDVAPNMFWDSSDKHIGFVKFDTKAHLWKPEVFDAAIDAAMEKVK